MNLNVTVLPFRKSGSGICTYHVQLAKILDDNDVGVTVVGFGDRPSDFEARPGIKFVSLGQDPTFLDWVGGVQTTYWFIRSRIKKYLSHPDSKSDLFHFIYPMSTLPRCITKAPTISTCWGFASPVDALKDAKVRYNGIWLFLGALADAQSSIGDLRGFKSADALISTTVAGAEYWRNITGKPTKYLPVPIGDVADVLHRASKSRSERVIFTFAERELDRPRNNLHVLLDGVQSLSEHYRDLFEIRIVGYPSRIIAARVKSLQQIGFHVELYNYLSRDQFLSLLSQTDVFVVLRYIKDQPGLTIIEALSFGIPIIAPDMPAYRDFLIDGVTGLGIDNFSPEQVADSLRCVIDDRDLLNRLKDGARLQFESTNSSHVSGSLFLKFYEDLLSNQLRDC